MTKRILALITVAVMIFSLIAFPVSAEAVTTSWGSVSVSDTGFSSSTLRANARAAFTWQDKGYIVSYSGTDIYLFDAVTYALVDTYSTGLTSFFPTYFYVDTQFSDYPLLYYAIGDTIYKWRFLYGSLDFVGSEGIVGPLLPEVPELVVDTNKSSIYYFQVMDSSGMIRFVSGTTLCDAKVENGIYTVYELKTSTYFKSRSFCFNGNDVYTLYILPEPFIDGSYYYSSVKCFVYKWSTTNDVFEIITSFDVYDYYYKLCNKSAVLTGSVTLQYDLSGVIYYVNDCLFIQTPFFYVAWRIDGSSFVQPFNSTFYVFDLTSSEQIEYKTGYSYSNILFCNGRFSVLGYSLVLNGIYETSSSYSRSYQSSIPIYSLSAYKVPTFYTAEDKLSVSDADGDGYDDESYHAGYEVGKDYYKNQDADVEAIGSFFVYVLSAVMSFLMYLGINISFRDVSIITVVFFVLLGLLVWWLIHLKSGGD